MLFRYLNHSGKTLEMRAYVGASRTLTRTIIKIDSCQGTDSTLDNDVALLSGDKFSGQKYADISEEIYLTSGNFSEISRKLSYALLYFKCRPSRIVRIKSRIREYRRRVRVRRFLREAYYLLIVAGAQVPDDISRRSRVDDDNRR